MKIEEDDRLNWPREEKNELNASEWLGAIIRYFWHLGKRRFDYFYGPKQLQKNARIGKLFKIVILLSIIFLTYLVLK